MWNVVGHHLLGHVCSPAIPSDLVFSPLKVTALVTGTAEPLLLNAPHLGLGQLLPSNGGLTFFFLQVSTCRFDCAG